jgi:hypothetical protein
MQRMEMNRSLVLCFLAACLVALLLEPAAMAEERAVDRVVVQKMQRRMDLMSGETVVRRYQIALGFAPEGDKQQEGDGRTPEGKYTSSRAAIPQAPSIFPSRSPIPMPPTARQRPNAASRRAATFSFMAHRTGG